MKRVLVGLATTVFAANLFFANTIAAQLIAPAKSNAGHVRIIQGPSLELAKSNWAIITWTSNNPGGSPQHYGVVHYGKSPKSLTETAKSPIRLNPTHDYTVFRVRMDDLAPRTTYYYTVDSMESNGESDGVKRSVKHFTTP